MRNTIGVSQEALTTADRVKFGLIASAFGALIGALTAVVVLGLFAWVGFPHVFNPWMIGFSATFFFIVGFVRGSEAADTVADSLATNVLLVIGAIGVAGGGATVDGNPEWRSSLWWTMCYFVGMVMVAWFA